MNLHTWWLFATATFFISAAPGPNMLLILSQSVRFNIRSAMWGALGCLCALLLMQTASAAGLGLLLRGAPTLFLILRWGGAIYLVYLGIRIFRAPVHAPQNLEVAVHVAPPAALTLFKTGFLTAASNPKALSLKRMVSLFRQSWLPPPLSSYHQREISCTS